jgi:hypothetical protein
MMVGGGEQVTLIDAPALAELARRVYALPRYMADRPLAVEPDLYQRGLDELDRVMRDRGWRVAVADWVKQPNYLFKGIPVVMADG